MRTLGVLLLWLAASASAEEARVGELTLLLPPGAVLERQTGASPRASHMVVLGALEKVNHQLQPERAEFVLGRKSSQTWYLPQSRRTRDVIESLVPQIEPHAELVYQCKGRGCGSSSHWANRIFGLAMLYGPEQYQYYHAFRITTGEYLLIYVAERATRKIYLHFELINPDRDVTAG